ncbi:TerD family protein [bacterium]|nr:TerD family protein [bacterium]
MAINLSKGGNISLAKEAPGLKSMIVGLGWDVRATDGQGFDLDASAFMLGANKKCAKPEDFIFYNNKQSVCGSVTHTGDNRTGEGEGDDETILVELDKVPANIEQISFVVTIHEAQERGQNFGMVSSAYIRLVDKVNNKEIARFDLSEDASLDTAMIFADVYRHNGEWKFKAVAQGFQGGLPAMVSHFGL